MVRPNSAQEQALITLLNRIYRDIHAIEVEYGIMADVNDYRPRIEYFHDAVRALTASSHRAVRPERLSVEFLAYDVSMLRYIQAHPMSPSRNTKLSPDTRVTLKGKELASKRQSASKQIKYDLAEHYKSYAVLFSALLADAADQDYKIRSEEHSDMIADVAALTDAIKGTQVNVDVRALLGEHVADEDIAEALLASLKLGTGAKRVSSTALLVKLKETHTEVDKKSKAMEKAHLTFAMNQLAIFETAQDMVKQLASTGMNLVGSFVETAIMEARRGGRGL